MRLILISLLLFPFLVSAQFSIPDTIRYLALGDSYTIGESVTYQERWPTILYNSLISEGFEPDTVEFIAQTGWRTSNLINAISNADLDSNYTMVSLLIGVNNQFGGRPISLYIEQFPELLSTSIALAGGDTSKVFVVSIPDYTYTPFGENYTNPDLVSDKLDEYNNLAKNHCDSLGVAFYNITPISREGRDDPDLVAEDGLHPSGKQYARWVSFILEQNTLSFLEGYEKGSVDLTRLKSWVLYNNNGKEVLEGEGELPQSVTSGVYFLKGITRDSDEIVVQKLLLK